MIMNIHFSWRIIYIFSFDINDTQELYLPISSAEVCNEFHQTSGVGITNSLCFGVEGEESVCLLDTGAPLGVLTGEEGRWVPLVMIRIVIIHLL